MKCSMRHTFNIDVDGFWQDLFFEPAYNQALFCDHLGFEEYTCLELTRRDDGSIRRVLRASTRATLPAVLQRLFADHTGYTEVGEFDPRTGHFVATVIPSVAADKISSRFDLWVVPKSGRQVERCLEVDTQVKLLGVGRLIESALVTQLRQTSEKVAAFTNGWLERAQC